MRYSLFFLLFFVPSVCFAECGWWSWGANEGSYCDSDPETNYVPCDTALAIGLPMDPGSEYGVGYAWYDMPDSPLYLKKRVIWNTNLDHPWMCPSWPRDINDSIYVGDDCPCTVPDPPECQEWYNSTGQEGHNCGGVCSAPCESYCPPGEEIIVDLNDESFCGTVSLPDSLGNCPKMTVPSTWVGTDISICIGGSIEYPLLAAAMVELPDGIVGEMADDASMPTDPDAGWEGGTVSTMTGPEIFSDELGPDAPAGAESSGTTTTTTTGADGDESTETETNYYTGAGGTGEIVGTQVETEIAPEDVEENYDLTGLDVPGESDYGDNDDLLPEKIEIIPLIQGYLNDMPIMNALDTITMDTSDTVGVCNVGLGIYRGENVNIDFCQFEDFLQAMGAILVVVTQASAILIIVGYKKKGDS